jgi:hypothetical protein
MSYHSTCLEELEMPKETPIRRARQIGVFIEELLKTSFFCNATVSCWVPVPSARQERRHIGNYTPTCAESLPRSLEPSVPNSNEQSVTARKVLEGQVP